MISQRQAYEASVLAKCLQGAVHTDSKAIAEVAVDFGRVARSSPQVVVFPANVADVVTVIRHARENDWTVTVRGAGHSQGGQSLTRNGLVLDTRNLSGIEVLNEDEGWVIVGAGTLWSTLVRATVDRGMMPPVLTDNLAVTIGGTLSVGGVGPASFRHGLQARHCLGLEVVLGTGERQWLTPESDPELFNHVLCGLGQFGIITKVKLRLRPFRRYMHSVYLTYRNLGTFLADAQTLMKREQVDYLEGAARPVGAVNVDDEQNHRYLLEVSTEVDALTNVDEGQFIDGLNDGAKRTVVTRETPDYLFRLRKTFARYKEPTKVNQAHPWVEHYLPFNVVEEYVAAVTASFSSSSLLLWPMLTEALQLPLFVIPEKPQVVLVGVMVNVPQGRLVEILPLVRRASELGIALGGKRYLSGWLDFDRVAWRRHYGSVKWNRMRRLKQQCDPDQILQTLPY